MWIYYNKLGQVTTRIPHGEIARQGATFNLYVAFDHELFKNEIQDSTGENYLSFALADIKNWLEENVEATIHIPNLVGEQKIYPDIVNFKRVKPNELIFDLKEGNYVVYKYTASPTVMSDFGTFYATIKLRFISLNNVTVLGNIPILVERTYGWENDSGTDYELPVASETTLGGIRIGEDFEVSGTGVLSLANKDDDYKTITETVTFSYTGGAHTTNVMLPKGLKQDEITVSTVAITISGYASVTNTFTYDSVTGKLYIQVEHTPSNYNIRANITYRILKSVVFENFIDNYKEYELPVASHSILGGVKVGNGLEIDNNGLLSLKQGSNNNVVDEKQLIYWDDIKKDVQVYSEDDGSTVIVDLTEIDFSNKKLEIDLNNCTYQEKPLWRYCRDFSGLNSQDFMAIIFYFNDLNNSEFRVIGQEEYDEDNKSISEYNTEIGFENSEKQFYTNANCITTASVVKGDNSSVVFWFSSASKFILKDEEDYINIKYIRNFEV